MRPWLALAALGALIVGYATANGVGVSMDSMAYIRGAENLARGDGYSVVSENGGLASVTHWPPLYSIVVSIPIVAGLSSTASVRLVNAACFFALIVLSALLARRLSPRVRVAPLLAAACVLISPDLVHCYTMAWSETLFLPLVLLAFLEMLDYSERGRRRELLAAGACFGLAVVCRYSGAAFVAGTIAWLLLFDRGRPASSRFARALAFGIVAGIPTAALFVRNYFATHSAHDRPFDPRFFTIEHVREAVEAVTRWLLPSSIPLRFRVLWLVAVAVLVGLCSRRNREAMRGIAEDLSRHGRFWTLAGLCVAIYLVFIAVTIVFFDFDVQFDPRMMSPVLVPAIVGFAVVAPRLFARPMAWPARLAALALAVSLVLLAVDSAARLGRAHREPAQFASHRWTQANAWEILREAPASSVVYSSSPYVSTYFTNRPVRPLHAAAATEDAYLLMYPRLGGENAALDASTRASLGAKMLDSTDVVVLYRLTK